MSTTDVYVINFNPTFDIHYRADSFVPYGESYGAFVSRNIGGKGVNVALSLCSSGIKALCACAVGVQNGTEFKKRLDETGCKTMYFDAEGSVRENITIHKKDFGDTRLSLDSFCIDKSLVDKMYEALCKMVKKDDILAFCGRLPGGVSVEDACEFLERFKKLGARIALDSNSFDFDTVFRLKPWMIKPNEHELEAMMVQGRCKTKNELVNRLLEGGVENVLVSLGEKGAELFNCDGAYLCKTPVITPLSTVGAGDSTVAGFIYAATGGKTGGELVKYACAFGTASCLEEGTNPPKPENVKKIFEMLKVEKT